MTLKEAYEKKTNESQELTKEAEDLYTAGLIMAEGFMDKLAEVDEEIEKEASVAGKLFGATPRGKILRGAGALGAAAAGKVTHDVRQEMKGPVVKRLMARDRALREQYRKGQITGVEYQRAARQLQQRYMDHLRAQHGRR